MYPFSECFRIHGILITILLATDVVVVASLFYVHGKHLRSCRDGQLT